MTTEAMPDATLVGLGDGLETVTCPRCGRRQAVALNRRESADFCEGPGDSDRGRCDFPLFWVPTEIRRGSMAVSDESLRRLPGTVGRVTVASLTCPHCAELNALTATVCIRCGLPMIVEAPPPVVEEVYVPPAEPAPILPGEPVPLWPWFVLLTMLLVMGGLAVLYLTNTWS